MRWPVPAQAIKEERWTMAKTTRAKPAGKKAKAAATQTRDAAAAAVPAGKITVEQLFAKMANTETDQKDLQKYFRIRPGTEDTFNPVLELDPATVHIPNTPDAAARGDMAVGIANSWSRARRLARFNRKIADGYQGPIIVSEGDSWFQFPILLDDTIDQLDTIGYALRDVSAAGDTLANMVSKAEYIDAIVQTGASVFLFSAGGNDVLGGGNLASLLIDFDPGKSPGEHILPAFETVLSDTIAGFDTVFRSVEALPGDIKMFCHGYDYVFPNNGKWLGKPMQIKGIMDKAFQRRITSRMIDRFNGELKLLCDGFAHVTYIDSRNSVGNALGNWHDELHPKNPGYANVAALFDKAIRAAKPRSFGRQPDPAAPRSPSAHKIVRNAALAQAIAKPAARGARAKVGGKSRRGLSLHVGLNHIDPAHYGSDNPLVACISDAEAMQSIARQRGYEVMGLLTDAQGTRDAVKNKIKEASQKLVAGDIFLYTYAGHGAFVPDLNGDEKDDNRDETWCLYDGMLLDDEAYELWLGFKEGVRILCVMDCCHSGSTIRAAAAAATFGLAVPVEEPLFKSRQLPASMTRHAFFANEAMYRQIGGVRVGDGDAILMEEIGMRPQRSGLKATVRLLSGCQDDEVSMDGAFNGRFTEELLKVWNGGRFAGDYTAFHKKILEGMPATQSPNHMIIGPKNLAFNRQDPFLI